MADFIKLYIVILLIPIAGIAVPAMITWARDLDATARRMRAVDEQNKIVAFWDNWAKSLDETKPTEEWWDKKLNLSSARCSPNLGGS